MTLFGKNYDAELDGYNKRINDLIKSMNKNITSMNDLQDLFSSLQDSVIQFAKIQGQHKAMLSFLINHATVDADAQEDLDKMMQEIMKVEKDIKQKTKGGKHSL